MRRPSTLTVATLILTFLAFDAPARASQATDAALAYARHHQRALGLSAADLSDVVVSSEVRDRHTGVTHVYLQQRHRGIEVHNAILTVNVRRNGKVLSAAGSRFFPNIVAAARGRMARRAAEEAVGDAARHLNLKVSRPFEVLRRETDASEKAIVSNGGVAAGPIEAKLVWLARGRSVRLAWRVNIEEASGNHWWNAFVDAETGELLAKEDLVVHDSAAAIEAAIARPAVEPAALPSFADIDGSSYEVFPLPFESPNDGGRSSVSGAADPAASPFGWHDTNGAAGAEFTLTQGNNVHAYTDIDANNVADPGSSPDGGAGLDFSYPLDLSLDPSTYRPAAVTNLFYWNNIMHDVAFGYGFDEAAGNFQVTNYSGAIGGGDDVRAEAQDGSNTNNANFATPGQNAAIPRPRMQMFVWTHPLPNIVTVNDGAIAGDYEASRATFGPQLNAIPAVTGTVVLVDDAVVGVPVPPATAPGTVNDGCEPFTVPTDSIALLDRGFCTFAQKVFNAQTGGAVAVIVANNAPGDPITMGFTPPIPVITIPVVMVSLDNGNLFKPNLPFEATLHPDLTRSINRDSDLDAGVIAHEYGHGISNRLTGGPNTDNCLGNAEQMGEGWSDWFALNLTTHPDDNKLTPRGIGNYLIYEGPDGLGIRPTPYSTDMTVNPATYASVADVTNISSPHGIGYVWNTMLWEVYWNLVDRYGYNADIYGSWTTGGNNLALQLVMDGMKFQPCRPGFVTGRDGILTAETALTGGANRCEIWRGFAKRGLGFSADQNDSNSRTDGEQAFDLPAECTAATFGGFKPPVDAAPALNDWAAGDVVAVRFTLSGVGGTPPIDSQPVDCTTLLPTGAAPSPVAMPGNSGVIKKGNQYQFSWLTDASWAGTCRRLTLRIPAPSDAVAYFEFH